MKKKILIFLSIVTLYLVRAQEGRVGINTINPQGTFHVDSKKDNNVTSSPSASEASNDFIVTDDGKVGVGISSVDPSSIFHVSSSNKGVIIPKVELLSPTDAVTIENPANGLIVYNTLVNASMDEGIYFNQGTPSFPKWQSYSIKKSKSSWIYDNTFDTEAVSYIDSNFTNAVIINNLDLGLRLSITVPAYTEAKIILNYSVPVGTPLTAANLNTYGYYGVRFLKNGIEVPRGSRKYSIPSYGGVNPYYVSKMQSVSAVVGDYYNNNTSSSVTIIYDLNGYIEAFGGTGVAPNNGSIRFNMYDIDPNPNYNWGRAYFSAQLFTRSSN